MFTPSRLSSCCCLPVSKGHSQSYAIFATRRIKNFFKSDINSPLTLFKGIDFSFFKLKEKCFQWLGSFLSSAVSKSSWESSCVWPWHSTAVNNKAGALLPTSSTDVGLWWMKSFPGSSHCSTRAALSHPLGSHGVAVTPSSLDLSVFSCDLP